MVKSCDLKPCPYWFAGEWTDVSERSYDYTFFRHSNDIMIIIIIICICIIIIFFIFFFFSFFVCLFPNSLAFDPPQCSTTCDNGTTTRQVLCLSAGVVARSVDEGQCSAATRPLSRKVCKIQDCVTRLYAFHQEGAAKVDYYWRLKMWTPVRFVVFVAVVPAAAAAALTSMHGVHYPPLSAVVVVVVVASTAPSVYTVHHLDMACLLSVVLIL